MYCNWMDHNYQVYVSLVVDQLEKGSVVKIIALGTSMEPAIKDSQELLISPSVENIKVGDIVFVKMSEHNRFIHRVCFIYDDFYILKGDNADNEDYPVHKSEIIGTVLL